MRLSINPFRLEAWYGEDIHPVLDLVVLAEAKGIGAVSLSEHVVMGRRDLDDYPFAPSAEVRAKAFTEQTNFPEPIVLLTAIAMRTRHLKLSTGVLLAPLRPAALLAKQIATLDVLSRGRLELSVGVGWQKTEYDAIGVPWEGRFGRMIEVVQACKLLWTQAPASFRGQYVSFEDIYCRPFPLQAGGPPIWFGIGPSDRNLERIARYADGWTPLGVPIDAVGRAMTEIRRLMEKFGRDPAGFRLRMNLDPIVTDGRTDLARSLAQIPALAKLGCTDIDMVVAGFCPSPDEFEAAIEEFVVYRGA